jgi:hypothetical protein
METSMDTTTALWLVVTAGGPVLLAIAIVYGIAHRRRLSRGEKAAQRDAVDQLYERKP